MKTKSKVVAIKRGVLLFTIVWVLTLAMVLPTPVQADNCLDDITNLADCMRTPFIREAITISASLLGVTPLVLVNLLANLGALNPFPNLLGSAKGSSGQTGWLYDLWNKIKPIIERISPDLAQSVERSAAKKIGANMAKMTQGFLDAQNKKSSLATPPKPARPVKPATGGPKPSGGKAGTGGSGTGGSGTGGSGTGGSGTGGSGTGGSGTGGSGPSGAGSGTGKQYKGPIKDLNVEVFDSEDAHKILQALGLIKSSVPADGKIKVTRSGLDNLLGQHPSNKPIELTLTNGKTVIINSVKGIAFDSGVDSPGGDPGTLDFTKGISIAAEVVEPGPPAAPPGPVKAPIGGGPGGGTGGKSGGGATPGGKPGGGAPGGGSGGKAGKSPQSGGKPGSLFGETPDQPSSGGESSSGGSKPGDGGKSADGSIIDKDASSATDDF